MDWVVNLFVDSGHSVVKFLDTLSLNKTVMHENKMLNMRAEKSSWKNEVMGSARERIPFEGFYTDAEADAIYNGLVPESMDDKWFVYSDNTWVYFHRSWSGQCIFMLKLDGSPAGVRVTEAWASRDTSRYNSPGVKSELELVSRLIKSLVSSEC